MNKFFWILNLSLVGLAVLATAGILRYHPAPAAAETETKRGRQAASARGAAPRTAYAPSSAKPAKTADVEPLWAHSLFRPDRTEEESAGGGDAAQLANLELIGVAIVGESKAAIIVGPETADASAATGASRFGRGGFTAAPAAAATATGADKAKEKAKRVYRLGQVVGNTGYTISAINLEDVELTKGSDVQTLMINRGSENSKKRLAAASAESAARAAMAAAQPIVTPQPVPVQPQPAVQPQPQPPPAAAGGTATSGAGRATTDTSRSGRDSSSGWSRGSSGSRSGRTRGGG